MKLYPYMDKDSKIFNSLEDFRKGELGERFYAWPLITYYPLHFIEITRYNGVPSLIMVYKINSSTWRIIVKDIVKLEHSSRSGDIDIYRVNDFLYLIRDDVGGVPDYINHSVRVGRNSLPFLKEDEFKIVPQYSQMEYKGLYGTVELNNSDEFYSGRVLNANPEKTYKSERLAGLEDAFKRAVDLPKSRESSFKNEW